eukprot:2285073-Rhodomonas_salina.2
MLAALLCMRAVLTFVMAARGPPRKPRQVRRDPLSCPSALFPLPPPSCLCTPHPTACHPSKTHRGLTLRRCGSELEERLQEDKTGTKDLSGTSEGLALEVRRAKEAEWSAQRAEADERKLREAAEKACQLAAAQ